MSAPTSAQPTGYSSLKRGLEILGLIQESGRLRPNDISERLDLPLSTVYRYIATLRSTGFMIDVDGYLLPSAKLAEPEEDPEHLVRYAAPVLKRIRDASNLTAILAVRIHTAAVCLEVAFAHPKTEISFQRGQVRALYAGASALPLLAFAPATIVREVVESDLRRYTSSTPERNEIERELEHVRAQGFAVSYGHLTPGMVAVGVPVIVDSRCLCSLSVVGEASTPTSVDQTVDTLRTGVRELLARMPSSAVQEAWLSPDE